MARRSIAWIVAASALMAPSWSQAFEADFQGSYAPPEVTMPYMAHEAHMLTIFLPDVPPPPDTGLYPTLIYSPAAMFAEAEAVASLEAGFGEFPPLTVFQGDDPGPGGGGGGPVITGLGGAGMLVAHIDPFQPALPSAPSESTAPRIVFLAEALKAGWAVVTVGSTGWNSWPTCKQAVDCNPCNLEPTEPTCPTMPPRPPGCWDTNLWYAPGSPEWDNFNLFWGEKDFTWARQWVGQNAAVHGLDNNRVVVAGTSTGAIYASFLAFGPNRAWSPSVALPTPSAQVQQDTRVAAIVAFEPNTWVKGLRPSWQGVHWPSSDSVVCGTNPGCLLLVEECHNRRAWTLGAAPGSVTVGVLEEASVSRWVRDALPGERLTPAFIAAGDGVGFPGASTGFKRNANIFPFQQDYDRYDPDAERGRGDPRPAGLVEGDPLLAFTSAPEVYLHDSWYAMNFQLDLQQLDETIGIPFHEQHSRLFLQDGHDWTFLPPGLLEDPQQAPMQWSNVVGLDGTYTNFGTLPLQSIDNPDLVPRVISWMEAVLGIGRTNGVVFRNPLLVGPAGVPNPDYPVYSSPSVMAGVPTVVEVDLKGAPGYDLASVLIFTGPSAPGSELVLSAGQALLCDIGTYFFSLSFAGEDPDPQAPAGVVRLTLPPAAPAGLTFYTQAVLVDAQQQMPFALTNALDITVLPAL